MRCTDFGTKRCHWAGPPVRYNSTGRGRPSAAVAKTGKDGAMSEQIENPQTDRAAGGGMSGELREHLAPARRGMPQTRRAACRGGGRLFGGARFAGSCMERSARSPPRVCGDSGQTVCCCGQGRERCRRRSRSAPPCPPGENQRVSRASSRTRQADRRWRARGSGRSRRTREEVGGLYRRPDRRRVRRGGVHGQVPAASGAHGG